MNENQVGQNNLLDATDCLEAIGVFRGWKNFLFVILLLSLLLSQMCFWAVNIGWVPPEGGCSLALAGEAKDPTPDAVSKGDPNETVQDANEASTEVIPDPCQPQVAPVEPNSEAAVVEPNSGAAAEEQQDAAKRNMKGRLFGIMFEHLTWVVRFVNAVLVLTATLYCLTMLFSLKVSLVGRLGGINHICRAFFLSLLMLVLLLPWQKVFGCVISGAMYTPQELGQWSSAETSSRFGEVLYYLRFTGYWLLILLLLLLSQFRSSRWARAILRRLEII